jgi:hypothetical protein
MGWMKWAYGRRKKGLCEGEMFGYAILKMVVHVY